MARNVIQIPMCSLCALSMKTVNRSCGVCVAPGIGVPLGWFYCFGCGEKGPWNKFAAKLGLTRIDSDDTLESNAVLDRNRLTKRRIKVGLDDYSIETPAGVRYPYSDWRGISGKLVRSAGGIMAIDRKSEVKLYFPVEQDVNGRYLETVGVIQANMEKEKGRANYVLQGGSQVKEGGLFPLARTMRMLKRLRVSAVMLVEGPRDALRLIQNGIPALSIISTTQWSESKAQSVAWICRRNNVRPVVMMDGDSAGIKAQREAIIDLSRYNYKQGKVGRVDLTKVEKDMDPAKLPQSYINKLRKRVSK